MVKKLIELHDIVKKHPYRIGTNNRYVKSYGKAIYKLIMQFYEDTKHIKGHFGFFFYEALSISWHFENGATTFEKYYNDGAKMDKDIIMANELIIGDIHKYIKTGKIEKLHLYYTDSNVGPKGRKSTLVRISKDKFEQRRPWL